MSATCTGSSVTAVRPTTPSPFRGRASRCACTSASSVFSEARSSKSSRASSYSKIDPPSRPDSSTARATMVVSTVSRSSDELTARPTSPSALSCSTDRVRSPVRASSSFNSRAFSMAMTAWSAKVWTSAIWESENGPGARRWRESTPIGSPPRMMGTESWQRKPSPVMKRVRLMRAVGSSTSGTWTTLPSAAARPVRLVVSTGRG